jgi:hypothetical protein
VIEGIEDTRSQRKRLLKKQRKQVADPQVEADFLDKPLELRQLYLVKGVGAEAAGLKKLSQISLTRNPPRTPMERAVKLRVQERAFAKRWKEERQIRERRLAQGQGQPLTAEESQRWQQDDDWLRRHALQRYEITQVDRMAYLIGQWD